MEIRDRKDMDPQYQWDLGTLFKSDADWEKALDQVDGTVTKLEAYKGRLSEPASVRAFLDLYWDAEQKISDLFVYAEQRHDEDTRDSAAKALYARIYSKATDAEARISFARPEILALSEEKLKRIVEADETKPYRFELEQLLEEKPHVLSAEGEAILATLDEALASPRDISGALMDADLTFEDAADSNGEKHELTGSNFVLLEQSPDRTLRENAFRNFYTGYKAHNNTFAATYAGIVKSSVQTAKLRHYGSSREMALAEEHIPLSVYDGLVDSVHRHMPSMHRYVALRKKLLGVDSLHFWDVYAPLVADSERKYSYSEAQELILEALRPLGSEYLATVRKAFSERWIDVYPNRGKRGGAYSSGTYDSNPYILANYTDDYESVSTIAHEMGHSMHTWRSNHTQPVQYANYTLFVAEVASTTNENLLVEDLLSKTDDPKERLFLLNQYLEGFKGTVYRQTMFAEFERDAHAMAERGEALTTDALNDLYRKLNQEYFGPDMVIDDGIAYEWSRIPHFYNPFYVFKYATSYSAAVAISERILHEGQKAVDDYLGFLSMGSSKYPIDELKAAGVDFTTSAPVDAALDKFDRILDEAEKCVREI